MLTNENAKRVIEFRDWVRQFEHVWSHLHVAALALLLEGEWVAIRLGVVLSDQARGPKPWGLPIVDEERILAFRTSLPFTQLDQILEATLVGHLDHNVVPGLDRTVHLTLPLGETPSQVSFHPYLGRDYGQDKAPRTWPRAELTIQSKSPAETLKDPWKRYAEIEAADRRFVRLAHGSLGMLGKRLALWQQAPVIQNLWNAGVASEIVAPIPVRLATVEHVRDPDVVRARVELGRLVRPGSVTLALRPDDHGSQFPPRRIPARKGAVTVDIARRVPPGEATVSLCFEPVGEIASRPVTIHPPLKAWPLAVAIGRLDKEHRLLRQGLAGESGPEFERAISILLGMVGYSSLWCGPSGKGKQKLPQPGDLQPGAAPDVMAYHEDYRDLLLIECTIGVVGSDKVTKLVGRSLRVRTAFTEKMGPRSPSIRAVLATSLLASEVGDAANASLRAEGAGLLARGDIDALLGMILDGRTPEEVRDRFELIFPYVGIKV